MGQGGPRRHSHKFKIEIAQRMLNGECVSALSEQYGLPRSMMYRWRDAYRKDGPEGLQRPIGRPAGVASKPTAVTKSSTEETLRRRVAELERTIGRQSVEIDFFKGVFKRLEAQPKAPRRGSRAEAWQQARFTIPIAAYNIVPAIMSRSCDTRAYRSA